MIIPNIKAMIKPIRDLSQKEILWIIHRHLRMSK